MRTITVGVAAALSIDDGRAIADFIRCCLTDVTAPNGGLTQQLTNVWKH